MQFSGKPEASKQLGRALELSKSWLNWQQTRLWDAGHHVVGHDDLGLLRIRIIQCTQLAQVVRLDVATQFLQKCKESQEPMSQSDPAVVSELDLLRESPVTVERLLVEGREAHSSRLLALRQRFSNTLNMCVRENGRSLMINRMTHRLPLHPSQACLPYPAWWPSMRGIPHRWNGNTFTEQMWHPNFGFRKSCCQRILKCGVDSTTK